MERAAGRGVLGDRIKVSVADYAIGSGETLTTSGLGSCLGIALYDPDVGVGGLVHPMLPSASDGADRSPERFVDSGIDAVVEEMVERGASPSAVEAKVTGGAAIVDFKSNGKPSIGDRNVAVARRVFEERGIDLVGEEVGDAFGRTMRFDTSTGRVFVERTDGVDTVL